jgi:hypothetical protein
MPARAFAQTDRYGASEEAYDAAANVKDQNGRKSHFLLLARGSYEAYTKVAA